MITASRGPRPRLAALSTLTILAALLAVVSLAAPAPAQPPAAAPEGDKPQVMMVPALNGYAPGSALPLVLLVRLPEGRVLPHPQADLEAGGPELTLEAGPGVSLGQVVMPPPEQGQEHRERALILAQLVVAEDARPGPREAKAHLTLALKGGKAQRVDFPLPINVLPAKAEPQVLSPDMLNRLGIELVGMQPDKAPVSTPAPLQDDPFASHGFWWLLLVVFAGGLGLNLTPCVYPLLPITVSYFGGRAQGGRGLLLLNSIAYWAGMAAMYSALGAFVSLSGGMLGQALTHPLVTLGMAGVLVALALSMFGLWELRLPAGLNRLGAANRQGVGGAFLMGLTVGILAAPCVGPFVLGLMTHVASVGQAAYGLAVFLALSAGLGLPLAVLAFFSGSITRLPGAGEWMIWVRRFFGVVLLLMAVSVARPLLGDAAYRWTMAGLGLAGGLWLGFVDKTGQGGFLTLKRVVGLALLAAAGAFWWLTAPAPVEPIAWKPYTPAALQEAAAAGRPAVVDFTASWCPPCRQMEAETFPDPRVAAAFKDFEAVRVDVTSDPGPEAKALMRAWRVRGVPTLAFIDRAGMMIPELTLVGFEGPDDFLRRLQAALAKAGPAPAAGGGK